VGFLVFGGLMKNAVKIGILYSTTGPYAEIGRDARDGADFAIEEVRAIHGNTIEPVIIDPHADIAAYLEGARVDAARPRLPSYHRHHHLARPQGGHSPCRKT
jgi:hypothetical protein